MGGNSCGIGVASLAEFLITVLPSRPQMDCSWTWRRLALCKSPKCPLGIHNSPLMQRRARCSVEQHIHCTFCRRHLASWALKSSGGQAQHRWPWTRRARVSIMAGGANRSNLREVPAGHAKTPRQRYPSTEQEACCQLVQLRFL